MLRKIITFFFLLFLFMVSALAIYLYTNFYNVTPTELIFAATAPGGELSGYLLKPIIYKFVLPFLAMIIIWLAIARFFPGLKPFFIAAILIPVAVMAWKLRDFHYLLIPSSYIADNYADPATVKLVFPAHKKNLIHIYLESVESTFSDLRHGGGFEYNFIPNLTRMAIEGESFNGNSEKINGAMTTPAATFTMGSAFAQETGLPLQIGIHGNTMNTQKHFFKKVVALGDILEANGYTNLVMKNVDMTFAGAELFYAEHGNFEVRDLKYFMKKGIINRDNQVWGGFEDARLFQLAKTALTQTLEKEQPFCLTIFTNDTHHPAGYTCDLCRSDFPRPYENVFACADRQAADFIDWLKKQSFYKDTVIVITGDHLSMSKDICDPVSASYVRKSYMTILNAGKEQAETRQYSLYDMFPTILSALGVKIEGDRLGLGSDLYSATPTLIERDGYMPFWHSVSKRSRLMQQLANIDFKRPVSGNAILQTDYLK